jgi:hypothetical protein
MTLCSARQDLLCFSRPAAAMPFFFVSCSPASPPACLLLPEHRSSTDPLRIPCPQTVLVLALLRCDCLSSPCPSCQDLHERHRVSLVAFFSISYLFQLSLVWSKRLVARGPRPASLGTQKTVLVALLCDILGLVMGIFFIGNMERGVGLYMPAGAMGAFRVKILLLLLFFLLAFLLRHPIVLTYTCYLGYCDHLSALILRV